MAKLVAILGCLMGGLVSAGSSAQRPGAEELGAQKPGADAERAVEVRVIGVVRDALGNGVPAAEVRLRVDRQVRVRTFADGEGAFAARGGPAGRPFEIVATAPGRGSDRVEVRARAGSLVHVELRLADVTTLTVGVTDEEGGPAVGAWVSVSCDLVPRLAGRPVQEGRTDPKGIAVFEGVPVGGVDVRVFQPHRALASDRLWLEHNGILNIRLRRTGGTQVHVHLIDRPKDVDAHLEITPIHWKLPQTMPSILQRPRVRGSHWGCLGLPDMRTRVRLEVPGYVAWPAETYFERGRPSHQLVFRLTKVGAKPLVGVLRRRGGAPLAGARIVARSPQVTEERSAETNHAGQFVLPCPVPADVPMDVTLESSPWCLASSRSTALADAGLPAAKVVPTTTGVASVLAGGQVELIVDRGGEVVGRVVDADGQAVRGRRVDLFQLRDQAGNARHRLAHTFTDTRGRYRLIGVPKLGAVPYLVRCGSTFSAPFGVERMTRTVDLRLPLPGTVEGVGVGADGRRIAGARVVLRASGRRHQGESLASFECQANREGRFVFREVPPGSYRMDLFREHSTPIVQSGEFEVRPGAAVRQELRVK